MRPRPAITGARVCPAGSGADRGSNITGIAIVDGFELETASALKEWSELRALACAGQSGMLKGQGPRPDRRQLVARHRL